MKRKKFTNHLKTHRQRSGLSQRDVGLLLGTKDQAQISRYERCESDPPLTITLGYEQVFRVPASELFPGTHARVTQTIESKLAALEEELGRRSAKDRGAKEVAKTLTWLRERKER
jgi:transcriptional regulator with XRE-family HTH domain